MGERRKRGEVSLERALSKLGVASRKEAGEWIRAGRVAVGGEICRDPGRAVVPERAAISVDGSPVAAAAWRTIAFHKPTGCVTTRRDPEGRPTVFDLLGTAGSGLVAVGRLDLETTGLLLLTSDTRLADWLTDPANGIERVYRATVQGIPDPALLRRMEEGIEDHGERLAASRATVVSRSAGESLLELVLTQGRNREVRRLCAAIGHEVVALERLSFGEISLASLERGAWRAIERSELARAFGPEAPIGRGPVGRSGRFAGRKGPGARGT